MLDETCASRRNSFHEQRQVGQALCPGTTAAIATRGMVLEPCACERARRRSIQETAASQHCRRAQSIAAVVYALRRCRRSWFSSLLTRRRRRIWTPAQERRAGGVHDADAGSHMNAEGPSRGQVRMGSVGSERAGREEAVDQGATAQVQRKAMGWHVDAGCWAEGGEGISTSRGARRAGAQGRWTLQRIGGPPGGGAGQQSWRRGKEQQVGSGKVGRAWCAG